MAVIILASDPHPPLRMRIPTEEWCSCMKHSLAIILLVVSTISLADDTFVIENFIEASVEGLRIQTQSHDATWGIVEAETWNVDQDVGEIVWTLDDGRIAVAPVQIIGTYNPSDGTFMWGWDHPSVDSALQESAKLVKALGEKHRIPRFTQQKISISDESEAWEFVAVANRLAESNGGYRGDSGGPIVFMTFGKVSVSTNSP